MRTLFLSWVAAAVALAGDPSFVVSTINKGDICQMSGGYICPKVDTVYVLVTWDEIADADGALIRGEWVDDEGGVHKFEKECAKMPEFPHTALFWLMEPGITPESIKHLEVATYRKVRAQRLR